MKKTKKNILFFIETMNLGGKERQLRNLINGLDTDKFNIVLLVKNSFDSKSYYLNPNISQKNLNTRSLNLGSYLSIISIISKFRPNIVYTWFDGGFLAFIPLKLFYKFFLIDGSIRNTKKPKYLAYFVRRILINTFAEKIIANSHKGISIYHAPSSKSKVIYNGFSMDNMINIESGLAELKIKINNRFVIAMIARIDDSKDHKTFINAGIDLLTKRNDIVFLIVGDGARRLEIEEYINPNFRHFFIFTGKLLNVEEIIPLINIGVLSSFSEGISNSIIEYMAYGKPVVVSNVSATNEFVIHNENGLLFEVGDYQSLSNYILLLLSDSELREKIGENAKNTIAEKFSLQSMIIQYENIFNSLN